MRGAEIPLELRADLPKEFHGPIGHSSLWLWLAVVALVVVALYYVVVTWWARPRRAPLPVMPAPPSAPPLDPRPAHLAELDRVAHEVASGRLPARVGHQQVSRIVRSYVGAVSPIPADRMTLADLRTAAPGRTSAGLLADAVELMYPPSFAPSEEGHAAERFPEAVARARHVVTTWT